VGRYTLLLAIPAVGLALAIGLFVYSRAKPRSVADWAKANDPVLAQLLALNPGLEIEDEFARVPIYWIKNPQSGRKILIPKSEAATARIGIHDCNPGTIPPGLLYPSRTESTCLEIENDEHKLSAYFFRTRDSIDKVVAFFNLLLEPNRRFTLGRGDRWDERREERKRDDGSRELIFSYFLRQEADVEAFIGYREERR
jgi:hypothetical protein